MLGPWGSGKSSLLAVAGGLFTPTAGRVLIDGTDLGALTDGRRAALRRRRVGYVFQQANLLPALTARDQLLMLAALDGRARRTDRVLHLHDGELRAVA